MEQDDAVSTFSYDGDGEADTFSLHQLRATVNSHFCVACQLRKLAEGGYHKVYEVIGEDATVLGIVRVASPAFPRDKLESEVATLRFLATHTEIPVPQVFAWNSDPFNPVGAEYMIMQKVPGVSANTQWDTLPMNVKERVVFQVARYLKAMFALRFEHAGSFYLSSRSRNDVYVGPIVSTPFYRAIDGVIRVPDAALQLSTQLSQYRGPFSNVSDYLQSFLHAELYVLAHHRPVILSELEVAGAQVADARLVTGERVLRKALELCTVYPGNNSPGGPITTPTKPFSLRLDDFRLSNIMIDDKSGVVTGLIDFEGTTVAPLWECAVVPGWLLDCDDPEGRYEGGSDEDRGRLLDVFWKTMDDTEWREMYENGKPFRRLSDRLSFQIGIWSMRGGEEWVDERLAWAKLHPGISMPEKT
ncbi:phosphotransferase enzyme family-domain-containing protein [Boletus edulis]|nr:phosphotransferase enzyme family-domain-containing protein [Boletus edulis]